MSGFTLWKIGPLRRSGDDADYAWFLREIQRELQDNRPEDWVQDERQPDNHEQRAPVPQLIAHFAEPNRANDGPAHGVFGEPA